MSKNLPANNYAAHCWTAIKCFTIGLAKRLWSWVMLRHDGKFHSMCVFCSRFLFDLWQRLPRLRSLIDQPPTTYLLVPVSLLSTFSQILLGYMCMYIASDQVDGLGDASVHVDAVLVQADVCMYIVFDQVDALRVSIAHVDAVLVQTDVCMYVAFEQDRLSGNSWRFDDCWCSNIFKYRMDSLHICCLRINCRQKLLHHRRQSFHIGHSETECSASCVDP